MIVDALQSDPAYAGGDYVTEPQDGLRTATDLLWIFGSAPLYNQSQLPTQDAADTYFRDHIRTPPPGDDANDIIYQFEASRDYNPEPLLGTIVAPLLAINSADDQINPPELGIVEREIVRVPHGRFVLLPISAQTRGHGTHTHAEIWQSYVRDLLAESGGPR
jgi:homoserine O-acetyltransferase